MYNYDIKMKLLTCTSALSDVIERYKKQIRRNNASAGSGWYLSIEIE